MMAVDYVLTKITRWHKLKHINDELYWQFIGDFCEVYGTEVIADKMAALGLW